MVYPDLSFPTPPDRPYFYTDFVTTVDGKAQVLENKSKYWPLGSRVDHETYMDLRAAADIFIQGKNTALGVTSVETINSPQFLEKRKKFNKQNPLIYLVMSASPTLELINLMKTEGQVKHILATTNEADVPDEVQAQVEVVRLGQSKVDVKLLAEYLHQKGFKRVLVEGGPHIMDDFFEQELIDEVFLTIAPKIVGGNRTNTITMVEGDLLSPQKVSLEMLSVNQVENEIFLRYKVSYGG